MQSNILIFLTLFSCLSSMSQTWEPMDFGFGFSGTGGLEDITINPDNGDIYAAGDMGLDGRDSLITGFTKWNRTTNRWERVVQEFNLTSRMIEYFEGEIYFGRFDGLYKLQEESPELLMNVQSGSMLGSRVIDGNLYVTGAFSDIDLESTFGVAIYNGENFTPFFSSYADDEHRLDDIEEYNGEIYVVGKDLSGLPTYNWKGFAKMSGDQLVVAHEEFTGSFFALWMYSLEEYQGKLYIGGRNENDLGFTGNGIQAFDGVNMFDVGGGANAPIHDMKVYQGELYVVGGFSRIGEGTVYSSNIGGEPCEGVAKWNGETWTCLNYDYAPNQGGFTTLDIYNDTLYAGGSFHNLSGDTAMSMIARTRIYPDTTLVSIEENVQDRITIYPNPTHHQFTIGFVNKPMKGYIFTLYNSLGEIVRNKNYPSGNMSQVIDVSSLNKGLYHVRLNFTDGVFTRKIMVE
jgi:hypothetical protein